MPMGGGGGVLMDIIENDKYTDNEMRLSIFGCVMFWMDYHQTNSWGSSWTKLQLPDWTTREDVGVRVQKKTSDKWLFSQWIRKTAGPQTVGL